MCICRVCSLLKANPKKIEKIYFRFCAFLLREPERALNSLFGSGLTFERLNDDQDLHPETPGRCRLGLNRKQNEKIIGDRGMSRVAPDRRVPSAPASSTRSESRFYGEHPRLNRSGKARAGRRATTARHRAPEASRHISADEANMT